MEITLSEKDLEDLAAKLERRISDRVIGLLASAPAFDALSERAKLFAAQHVNGANYVGEAAGAFAEHLKKDGEKLLRRIVTDAVKQVQADDPELRKTVARAIYEAALNHAKLLKFAEGDDD